MSETEPECWYRVLIAINHLLSGVSISKRFKNIIILNFGMIWILWMWVKGSTATSILLTCWGDVLQISTLADQRPNVVQTDSESGLLKAWEILATSTSQKWAFFSVRVTQGNDTQACRSSASIGVSPQVAVILIKGMKCDETAGKQLEIHYYYVLCTTMRLQCKCTVY